MSEQLNSKHEQTEVDSSIELHCNQCFIRMKRLSKAEWICPECGNHAHLDDPDDIGTLYFEYDPDAEVTGFEDIPEGCLACGSDMYPGCTSNCPLTEI